MVCAIHLHTVSPTYGFLFYYTDNVFSHILIIDAARDKTFHIDQFSCPLHFQLLRALFAEESAIYDKLL